MEKQCSKNLILCSTHHHDCTGKSKYKELKKICPFYWLFLQNPFVGNPTDYIFYTLSTFKKKRYHTNP